MLNDVRLGFPGEIPEWGNNRLTWFAPENARGWGCMDHESLLCPFLPTKPLAKPPVLHETYSGNDLPHRTDMLPGLSKRYAPGWAQSDSSPFRSGLAFGPELSRLW